LKIKIIIPARFNSSRFPGKPIKKILGLELVIRVANICAKVVGKNNVFIATDDIKIIKVVNFYKYKYILTSRKCLTGTDRIAEASRKIYSDIYINVQGDEPLIKVFDIKKIIEEKKKYLNHVICGYAKILTKLDYNNKNVPKVVFNNKKELLYASRALIPSSKDNKKFFSYYKQVCIYAFSKRELNLFSSLGRKSTLEKREDIEILRFFELGIKIKMVKTFSGSVAVDLPSDIKKVEKIMLK
jgi:3-deoxy-manno-octulosonate cytidylyltransferase (CMP-KDO synthetase)